MRRRELAFLLAAACLPVVMVQGHQAAPAMVRRLELIEAELLRQTVVFSYRTRGHPVNMPASKDPDEVGAAPSKLLADYRILNTYCPDNRQEVKLVAATSRAIEKNMESVAAIMPASFLEETAGGYVLHAKSFAEVGACSGEPFLEQPVAAVCTAFVYEPNIVATASHCVKGESDMYRKRIVFGYREGRDVSGKYTFAKSQVFEGTLLMSKSSLLGADWALIQISGNTPPPLRHRTTGKPTDGAEVYVIGHPIGLPAKHAGDAHIRNNSYSAVFVANLDTFGGNSGSPVFNAATDEVEGLLARGETDFMPAVTCMASKECPTEGCEGEDVTRITVLPHIQPGNVRASLLK